MAENSRLLRLLGTPQHRVFFESIKREAEACNNGLPPPWWSSEEVDYISGAFYLALQTQGYIGEASDVGSNTRLDELEVKDDSTLALLIEEMVHQASWEHMGIFRGVLSKYQTTDTVYQLIRGFALEKNYKTSAYLAYVNEFSHGPGYGLRNDGTFLE